jgi:hypothetical protein
VEAAAGSTVRWPLTTLVIHARTVLHAAEHVAVFLIGVGRSMNPDAIQNVSDNHLPLPFS